MVSPSATSSWMRNVRAKGVLRFRADNFTLRAPLWAHPFSKSAISRSENGSGSTLKLGAFKLPACHAIALVGIPAGRICADREACGSAEGRSPGMAR